MKLNKNLGFIFLIFAITFAPISFSNIFVQSQTSGSELIDGYQEWTQNRSITGLITVNTGATLVIKKGTTLTFNGGNITVKGNLIVSGTVKNPVKFQRAEGAGYYSIKVESGGKLIMRNSDMSGAGLAAFLIANKSILNTANAFYEGGININGGTLNVQGSNFHDNDVAINISRSSAGKVIVNRSKFSNSKTLDVYYNSGSTSPLADFRYNWWGSPAGPSQICEEGYGCYYDKMDGKINVSSWLVQEDFRDPVIIIPGILGSFDFFGEKKLDPFLHTYDYLYETFKLNGYTPKQNLFTFPYEWRDSNIVNAQRLKTKINEIKQENNWPKVDIIAHSMGGLLAREYIESGYYGNDVDQLITLGTPQKGAPEDYLAWEGGEIGIKITDILDNLAEKVFALEAHEKGFSGIVDYVRNRPISSIQELLPTYSYLYDYGNQRIYPTNYPANLFLETLNNSTGIFKLNNIEFDNIVGNLHNDESTISGFNVVESDDELLWEHGYPEDFDSIFGDHGLVYGDGDGTVPLESASLPTADEKIETNAKHGALPEEAANISFELLTKNFPQNISISKRIKNIISIFVFSPIDIQVVAPDGKRIGKNFETGEIYNEIPGAYYTGYDTDSEFLTIPNPADGEYIIITQGTGDGDYKIEVTKLAEDSDDPQIVTESTGTIEGIAVIGRQEKTTIEVNNYEVITKDMIPPIVTINYPKKNEDYLNNQILNIGYKVEDNKTTSENILIDIYLDDAKLDNKNIDLSLQKLGNHKIKIVATDEAANIGFAEVDFKTIANINTISDNVIRYQELGYIFELKTADFLQVKIKDISHTLDMIAKMSEKNNGNPPENKAELLDKQISDLINFILGKFAGTIHAPAGELLAESLNFIKK